MKKLFLSLMLVAVSAMAFAQQWTSIGKDTPASPVVKLVSSSEQQVVVDFTLGGFGLTRVNTPNGVQQVVSVPEMATSLDAGAPNLPYYPVPVLIGDMAEMDVKVTASDYTDYNVEVAPSKGNISRQIDPETVPYTYGEMYSQNAFYPAMQAYLDAPYILRDCRGQNIVVTPFAYNPVTKTLRVYHHLTITMNKVSDKGENPKVSRKSASKVDSEMQQTYRRRFINYGQNGAKYNFIQDRGEMLVICADQFMAGMEDFVAWKNQSGRPTTMVSVTEVGGNNDVTIKNYITDLYNNPEHNLTFVLFVGDYDHITPHPVGNERSDNWFGQVEGNDHYDDVLIGRFSVQTDAHVANHVNKVIYYERDLAMSPDRDVTWVNKGLGIGYIGAGSGHYGEDDYQHIDLIRDTLEHYTYEHVTELHGGGGGASPTSISNTINDGVSIINYCNHGSETSWGVANYSTSHVNALVNDYKWPVVWSVACLNGKFNHGGANGECFAESWMRATDNTTGVPTGAIGGMFSWMSQPWIPPMYGQDEMVDIFTEWRSTDLFNHTLGGASLNGNMNVIDKSGSSGYDTHDTWILFGDPSLMMRSDNPVSMNVTCNPPVLMLTMSELVITAEDTPYGIATLMMDGEVLATGDIYNGACTLSFEPLNNVGNATLTVMGYNKLTEVLVLEVLPAEGAFITVTSLTPDIAPVNVETRFGLALKNVGADPTVGTTTVSLSCDDERLTLVDSEAEFDVLPAEEIVFLDNEFSCLIAEGVEDATRFKIDITMTCGDAIWTGKAYITAGQAVLEYAGAVGANGFVPGESYTLIAAFENVGHYMATNVIGTIASASPYVTILYESTDLGTLDANGTAFGVFDVQISEDCPESEQIDFNFNVVADGDITANGTLVLKNSCNIIFDLVDSYGDGWNGNKLVVSFSDGSPQQLLTINSGSSATYTIEVNNGTTVTLSWIAGQYSSECTFTVKYEDGTVIYEGGANVNYEFVCDCSGGGSVDANIYDPIENLQAEVNLESIILTWDAAEGATGYVITRNGVLVGDTEEPTFTDEVFHEDFYTYCVIAEYEDGFSIPATLFIQAEWGIDENSAEFAIYPNPVSNTLYISGGNAQFSYELFNGMGQMVTKGNGQGMTEINVNGMAKGIYFLRLSSGTQVRMEKVVVD